MIREIIKEYDDRVLSKIILENNVMVEITWESLLKFLDNEGYFDRESYDEVIEEYDDLDLEERERYYSYWEEIEVSFQGPFFIVGLFNASRQGGTIVIYDCRKQEWCYVNEASFLYAVLILEEFDLILFLNYVSQYMVNPHHLFLIGKFSDYNSELKELEIEWNEISYFDKDKYSVDKAGIISGVDSESICEYGVPGIYYSKNNKKVYFYDCGGLVSYSIQELVDTIS